MKSYVYVVFDFEGMPRYVGVGRGARWQHHNMNCSGAHPELRKIREANGGGELPIVVIRSNLTNREALAIETALIHALGRQRYGGILVNKNNGGNGAGDEGAEKLRQMRLGKPLTEEAKIKIGNAHRGKKRNPETGAAISAALKGRVFTTEWRAKLSAAQKTRKRERRTEASKQKIREITTAYWAARRANGLPLRHSRKT
jgi:hypothetical protein